MKDHRKRTAAALLDAVVAAAIVMVTIAIAVPTVVQSARIWKQTRNFQIACDELAAQMDALVALPSKDRQEAITAIEVHPEVSHLLKDAKIEGQIIAGDRDKRLQLSINWKRIGTPPPVTLVAWLKPIDGDINGDDEGSSNDEQPRNDTEPAEEVESNED